jgi:hypothetical protein
MLIAPKTGREAWPTPCPRGSSSKQCSVGRSSGFRTGKRTCLHLLAAPSRAPLLAPNGHSRRSFPVTAAGPLRFRTGIPCSIRVLRITDE